MKARMITALALLALTVACSAKSPTAAEPHGPARDETVTVSGGMGSGH